MSEVTFSPPPALIRKLDEKLDRHQELESLLNDPVVLSNSQRLVPLSKEKGQLEPVVERYRVYQKAAEAVRELTEMSANRSDAEMADLAAAELPDARTKADALLENLKDELLAA
jgi:protein subunit release factor A